MRSVKHSYAYSPIGIAIGTFILLCLAAGLYLLSLVTAPQYSQFFIKPIDSKSLPEPKVERNRIIIPKINVDIEYGTNGLMSLDSGALWRYPERGNPKEGGNMVIAAHRFTIRPTPQATIKDSPFFHIDQLVMGDEIIIDYSGKRYHYSVVEQQSVNANQTEIEHATNDSRLTLYSCDLGGARSGRIVIIARPTSQGA